MARMKKTEVVEALRAIPNFDFDEHLNYNALCKLLKDAATVPADPGSEEVEAPTQITIVNRLKKRNTFLADAVRDQRDDEFLNREISQRKYKGKLLRTTRTKEYVVSADGYWVTTFIIDLKD